MARSTRHELRALAAGLGSDVPSQVEPRHAIVTGTGEIVEPIELGAVHVVLVPDARGLSAGEVYAELDRSEAGASGSTRRRCGSWPARARAPSRA